MRSETEAEIALMYRKAYEAGKRAAGRGFARINPYVGDEATGWWFDAGFDGLTMDEAWESFRKELAEITEVSSG